jgi:serine/threonine protein kinase
VKIVHLGLNFDNIYITKEGKWKLSGFSNSQIHTTEGLEGIKNFRCSNYYYCAPEVVELKKF